MLIINKKDMEPFDNLPIKWEDRAKYKKSKQGVKPIDSLVITSEIIEGYEKMFEAQQLGDEVIKEKLSQLTPQEEEPVNIETDAEVLENTIGLPIVSEERCLLEEKMTKALAFGNYAIKNRLKKLS